MSPLLTHRRARRRPRARRLVVLVCLLIVVAVLVGGLIQIGAQSEPFGASVNRSFATQAAVLVNQSNATAASLRRLMTNMPSQTRQSLGSDLGDVSAQATAEASGAGSLANHGAVQRQFALVLAQREQAVQKILSAIDGLLGIHPVAVIGAPEAGGSAARVPSLLSSTEATDRIAAAGRLLAGSDRTYRQLRQALARMAGHARLPSSRWVTASNIWQIGPVAAQIDLVVVSPSLVATHRLVLSAVGITPPALPSPTGVAVPTASLLSPTTRVTLQVVLSNEGSVDELHASVKFALASVSTGAATTVTRTNSVAADRSTTLSPVTFKVRPGNDYQLTVAVTVPAGQTDLANTTLSEALQIAPST